MDSPNREEFLDFESSLMETISKTEYRDPAIDAAIDLTETALDELFSTFQDEVLSEVPVIKTFYSLAKTGIAFSNYNFLKKMLRFVAGFEKPDEVFKSKLEEKYENVEYKRNLGRDLVNSISLFDEISKSDCLFKIFRAYVIDEIDYSEFKQFTFALQSLNIANIGILRDFYQINVIHDQLRKNQDFRQKKARIEDDCHLLQAFAFIGLISMDFGDRSNRSSNFPFLLTTVGEFKTNEFGKKFLQILDCQSAKNIGFPHSSSSRRKSLFLTEESLYKSQIEEFIAKEIEKRKEFRMSKYKGYDPQSGMHRFEVVGGGVIHIPLVGGENKLMIDQEFLLYSPEGGFPRLFKPIE